MMNDDDLRWHKLSTEELAAAWWDARQKMHDMMEAHRKKEYPADPLKIRAANRENFVEIAPLKQVLHILGTHLKARIGDF